MSDKKTYHPTLTVETYAELSRTAKAFAKSASNNGQDIRYKVLVYGRGGTGKSFLFTSVLEQQGRYLIGDDPLDVADEPDEVALARQETSDTGYHVFGSATSVICLYTSLYQAPDAPVIFDDCDTLLKNSEMRAKVKEITDSRNPAVVRYDRKSVPVKAFTTSCPVVVLSNEAPGDNVHISAIVDRFNELIEFNPTPKEVLSYAKKNKVAKPTTIDLIGSLPIVPSLRMLKNYEADLLLYGHDEAVDRLLRRHAEPVAGNGHVVRKIHPQAVKAMNVMEKFDRRDWLVEFGKLIGKPIKPPVKQHPNYSAVQRAWARVRSDAEKMLKAKRASS